MFVDMKKILVLFICLIFSNISFAIPGWLGFGSDHARCKVNYTRLNLVTGVEKNVKITSQYDDIDDFDRNCDLAISRLYEKIKDWLKKSKHNIVANLTAMYCKSRSKDGIFSNEWSAYKQCYIGDSQRVILNTAGYYPDQMGYKAHECRLLETTQEQMDNSPFCR
jgi:hypothetical protein